MIEQKWQASSQPSVDSARSTMARASSGSDAARIIVPKMRCRRCLAIIDERASGSACCSSRIAADAVALGDPHLGQPLQRVRLTGGGAEVAVQVAGFRQLGRGELQVAREQRRFADQRRGERGGPQRSAAPGGRLQVAGHADHLGVGRRSVEQVLGRAEVAVEDGVGDLRVLTRPTQLERASDRTSCPSGAPAGPAARRDRAPSSCVRRRAPAAVPRRPRSGPSRSRR